MSRAYTSPEGLEQLRKNSASVKDFRQTQATETDAARDRGGSPDRQFSPLATSLARRFPWFKGILLFHLQLFQFIKGSEKDQSQYRGARHSSITGVKGEGREQDWSFGSHKPLGHSGTWDSFSTALPGGTLLASGSEQQKGPMLAAV